MPRLTKRAVENASPQAKAHYIWDDQIGGFGVKVLPNGQRRYLVESRVGGGGRDAPQRWQVLGSHGAITCDQARDLARQIIAAVARGSDPQGDRLLSREAPTMSDLWARYEQEHLPRKKASSAKDDQQKWVSYIRPALAKKGS